MRMGIVGNPAIYMACVSAYMPFFFFFLFFFFFFFSLKKYKKLSPIEFNNSAIVFGANELYECGC